MKTANLNTVRHGALALALLAGAALLPQAATAGSVHGRGDFGGNWIPIAPSDHYDWRYTGRYYYSAPVYVAPNYVFGPSIYDPDFFGPPVYEDNGPGVALVAPDVGVAVDID
jgi:hypothetical protein